MIGNRNFSWWSLRGWLALAHAGINFELDPNANEYRDTVLSPPDVERWYADSRQETEVLDIYE